MSFTFAPILSKLISVKEEDDEDIFLSIIPYIKQISVSFISEYSLYLANSKL